MLGISIRFGLMHQTPRPREVRYSFTAKRGREQVNECGIYSDSENGFARRSIDILELRILVNCRQMLVVFLITNFIFKK